MYEDIKEYYTFKCKPIQFTSATNAQTLKIYFSMTNKMEFVGLATKNKLKYLPNVKPNASINFLRLIKFNRTYFWETKMQPLQKKFLKKEELQLYVSVDSFLILLLLKTQTTVIKFIKFKISPNKKSSNISWTTTNG